MDELVEGEVAEDAVGVWVEAVGGGADGLGGEGELRHRPLLAGDGVGGRRVRVPLLLEHDGARTRVERLAVVRDVPVAEARGVVHQEEAKVAGGRLALEAGVQGAKFWKCSGEINRNG